MEPIRWTLFKASAARVLDWTAMTNEIGTNVTSA
jgi:hypothetical protein